MKRTSLLLTSAALLACSAQAQVQISTLGGNTYSQNFNTLATSGTSNPWADNSTLPGWYASRASGGTFTTYRAEAGAGNSGALYSFGTNGVNTLDERALGSISSGTPVTIAYGVRFVNDTSDYLTNITIAYTGEQWRNGGNTSAQPLSFAYKVSGTALTNPEPAVAAGSGGWIGISALDFTSPIVGSTATALDGNASANRTVISGVELVGISVQPGEELFIRWYDINDAGNDHGLAVDDLTVTYNRVFVPPTGPTVDTEPQSTTAAVWTSPSLSVVVSGTPPLYYQWYKDNSPISNGGNVSGATNATISFTSVLHTNAGNYKVVVSNSVNSVTSQVATLTVEGFAITGPGPTNTLAGTPVAVTINFVDNQTPITSVTAVSASQQAVADANISVTGSGNSRTLTLSPVAGSKGVAIITATATDGSFSTNISFPVLVVPNSAVLFNDYFDYGATVSLITNSYGQWTTHGGTAGDMQVVGNSLFVSRLASEDVNAMLLGAPYPVSSDLALYSKFTVNFVESPLNTYFAHFKDDGTFNYRARVWGATNNAAPGLFRLGIGNSSSSTATTAQFPLDLDIGQTYTVVTKLVLATGASTIWVNPTSENDTHVTADDAVPTPVDISTYCFRQNSGGGRMAVDDLVVGTSFAAVTETLPSAPTPETLNQQFVNNQLILNWTSPAFSLASSTNVYGPYYRVDGATSPYTNNPTSSTKFFRLVYP